MVDEKEELQDQEESEETSKGKKSKTKLIIIIMVAAFLVLGVGGFGVYKFVLEKPPETLEVKPQKKTTSTKDLDKIVGTMFPLETFLVNIDDEDETRFLKTKLILELGDESMQEEVDMRIAQVRDTILLLLSSKDFSEIRSLDGKYILREEILEQLNGVLVTGKLKNVYFTEFVVQ
jgi:flagellar FliL protein